MSAHDSLVVSGKRWLFNNFLQVLAEMDKTEEDISLWWVDKLLKCFSVMPRPLRILDFFQWLLGIGIKE